MTLQTVPQPVPKTVHWIDLPSQLPDLCRQLEKEPRLAVDTEFVRTNTYYPIPGLIQIATPTDIFLVDPVRIAGPDLQSVGAVLLAPNVELLMHSGGEDLELFQQLWGGLPVNLLDTQIAASFAGFDRQTGLQRLLKETLNVDLGKEETRSDWTQRPLTESQRHYAAEDVRHLFRLAELLLEKLNHLQRIDWCKQECGVLLDRYRHKTPDDELYLDFVSGWKFKPEQQAALQHLASWRERMARERNIPRTFIGKDAVLYGLVEKQPRHKGALEEIGVQGSSIRRWGDEMLKQLQIGLQLGKPSHPIPAPLSRQQQDQYKALRNVLATLGGELGMVPELLASKAQLSDYILARAAGQDGSEVFTGWRAQVLLPRLNASS
ncbi:MAG TPA: ribonuclease D [Dongiaceae bacterium]|nr:ribonuclease D [Dongiaceae bacterium]